MPTIGSFTALTTSTGTGAVVLGTSPTLATPTITTSAIVPMIIGGTGTGSDLNLQTTSGIGAAGADMHFLVGNNGANEAMTILNNGNVGIGDTTPDALLDVAGTLIADTSVDITGSSGARSLYIRTGGIASFYDSVGAEQGRSFMGARPHHGSEETAQHQKTSLNCSDPGGRQCGWWVGSTFV